MSNSRQLLLIKFCRVMDFSEDFYWQQIKSTPAMNRYHRSQTIRLQYDPEHILNNPGRVRVSKDYLSLFPGKNYVFLLSLLLQYFGKSVWENFKKNIRNHIVIMSSSRKLFPVEN